MLNSPFSEEIPSNVHPGPPLAQPEAVSPCPFAGYPGENAASHLGYSLFSGSCGERSSAVRAPARPSPGRGRPVPAHGNAASGRAMNNLTGLVLLTGIVSRPAGTLQRRLLAPLPPGVIAGGTQGSRGNSLARRCGRQPVTAGAPAPAAVELSPGECAPVLCLLRFSVMGLTACLLTCRGLMEFSIHYRYIALEKKKS